MSNTLVRKKNLFSLFLPSLSPTSLSNPGAFPLKPPPSRKEETFPSGKYVPRYETFLLVIIVLSAYCSQRHFLCCCRCHILLFLLSYVFILATRIIFRYMMNFTATNDGLTASVNRTTTADSTNIKFIAIIHSI